jgi:hypothetical protein
MNPKINDADFYKSIKQAILENRHVDYLQEVVSKYEEYKKEFGKIFTSKNPKKFVYKFRITYLLKKPVWRDIELFGEQTFLDLAETVIHSMGWDNDHMHGFEIPEHKRKPDPFFTGSSNAFFAPGWEDDPHPTYKTDEIRILDLDYNKMPKLDFIFDFGDGHKFDIEFKGSREPKKEEKNDDFPKVIDQRGIGPEQYPDYE